MRSFIKGVICALALISTSVFGKSSDSVVLTKTNHALLRGEVNAESVGKVQQFLVTSPEKDVYLYIDSPGGSVFDGLALVETMETSGKNITCIASTAASMAFIILEACTTRAVTKSAMLMQHVSSYGVRGQEPNNFSFANLIHRVQIELEERQAERIGMDVEEFRDKVHSDWWLFGDEAVEANVADKVMSVRCDAELAKGKYTEKVQVMFWTIDLTFSECPLLSAPIGAAKNRIGVGNDEVAQKELIETLRLFNVRETVKNWKESGSSPLNRYSEVQYVK